MEVGGGFDVGRFRGAGGMFDSECIVRQIIAVCRAIT